MCMCHRRLNSEVTDAGTKYIAPDNETLTPAFFLVRPDRRTPNSSTNDAVERDAFSSSPLSSSSSPLFFRFFRPFVAAAALEDDFRRFFAFGTSSSSCALSSLPSSKSDSISSILRLLFFFVLLAASAFFLVAATDFTTGFFLVTLACFGRDLEAVFPTFLTCGLGFLLAGANEVFFAPNFSAFADGFWRFFGGCFGLGFGRAIKRALLVTASRGCLRFKLDDGVPFVVVAMSNQKESKWK